jgi:hypothetical protein
MKQEAHRLGYRKEAPASERSKSRGSSLYDNPQGKPTGFSRGMMSIAARRLNLLVYQLKEKE